MRERAAVRHRVLGVGDEVEQRLHELVLVGHHVPEVGRRRDLELALLAEIALQQRGLIAQHLAEADHLVLQRLLAGERQQLAHQLGGAIGARLDVHDVFVGDVLRPMHGQQHVGEAEDGRQHVVEVVRDAARQLADDFHLLALREARFERLLLGRVDDVEDRRLARAAGRERAHVDARDVIALGAGGDLDRHVVHAPGDDLLQALVDGSARCRIGGAAQRIGGRHAGAGGAVEHHAAEGGVGADDAAVRAEHGDAERRRLEEAREAGAGFIALELGGAFAGEIDDGERQALAARHGARQQARRHARGRPRASDRRRGSPTARRHCR